MPASIRRCSWSRSFSFAPVCYSLTSKDAAGKAYINYRADFIGWVPSRAYLARAGLRLEGFWPANRGAISGGISERFSRRRARRYRKLSDPKAPGKPASLLAASKIRAALRRAPGAESRYGFGGRKSRHGQGMHLIRQFVRQSIINAALALDPRQAGEFGRHDADGKMGFALAAVIARGAGMAGMAAAFVLNDQQAGRKCGGEFFADAVGNAHASDEAIGRGLKVKQ